MACDCNYCEKIRVNYKMFFTFNRLDFHFCLNKAL